MAAGVYVYKMEKYCNLISSMILVMPIYNVEGRYHE